MLEEKLSVSFTGAPEYMDRRVGYGEASAQIFKSFRELGVECLIKSREPNIGISFVQPSEYTFASHQYKIGYTPWESTEVFYNWKTPMSFVVDELWATSDWVADVFRKFTDKPVFVYKHGVDPIWKPKKRELNSKRPFRFLHIGEPACRKDGQMVVEAFIEAFGNNPNYELVLKCSKISTVRVPDPRYPGNLSTPGAIYSNITVIESYFTTEQMNDLYDVCDAFVYPSWGEGFGFNPLQAMAQGIPTICTSAWADYKEFITIPLESVLSFTPWQNVHPGMMYKPDKKELIQKMKELADNYEKFADIAYTNSFLIHKKYNWQSVSGSAIKRLKEIQKTHF